MSRTFGDILAEAVENSNPIVLLEKIVRELGLRPEFKELHETGRYSLFSEMTNEQVLQAARDALHLLEKRPLSEAVEVAGLNRHGEPLKITIPGETGPTPPLGFIPDVPPVTETIKADGDYAPGRIYIPEY